ASGSRKANALPAGREQALEGELRCSKHREADQYEQHQRQTRRLVAEQQVGRPRRRRPRRRRAKALQRRGGRVDLTLGKEQRSAPAPEPERWDAEKADRQEQQDRDEPTQSEDGLAESDASERERGGRPDRAGCERD